MTSHLKKECLTGEREAFEAAYFVGVPSHASERGRAGDSYQWSRAAFAWSMWQTAWKEARAALPAASKQGAETVLASATPYEATINKARACGAQVTQHEIGFTHAEFDKFVLSLSAPKQGAALDAREQEAPAGYLPIPEDATERRYFDLATETYGGGVRANINLTLRQFAKQFPASGSLACTLNIIANEVLKLRRPAPSNKQEKAHD